jgi:outer membrane protein, heavy metal efflux system
MYPLGLSRAFAVSHAIRTARSGRRRWSLPLILALPLAVALLPALPPPVAGISRGTGYPLPAVPPDTVRLTLGEALEILEERSPELAAARARSEEAQATLRQARAFPNPSLFAEAENLGALEATSGFPGRGGVQGTVGIALPLHPGGLRGRTMDVAGAAARGASVREERERVEESGALALALVRIEEAEARLAAARGEAEATGELHRILSAQALEGRAALGDAARARLEWTRARALVSRREGETTLRSAEAARILGLEPGTFVGLELPAVCPLPEGGLGEPGFWEDLGTGPSGGQTAGQTPGQPPGAAPDPTPVSPLTERTRQQEAEEALARARRVPALVPQVGWRREAGAHALSVGLGVELPLFDRRGGEVEAAAARTRVAREEERGVQLAWTSALHAQRAVLAALAGAAGAFDEEWRRALELTVSAAEAAFREGEGTLEALLQARRARLESLEELRSWQTEVRTARLALYGLEGRIPDDRALCARVTGEDER